MQEEYSKVKDIFPKTKPLEMYEGSKSHLDNVNNYLKK